MIPLAALALAATPIWTWAPGEVPLDVVIDVEMERWRPQVEQACRWWNLQLGYEVFNTVDELRAGAGLVIVAPLVEPDPPPPERPKMGRARKTGASASARMIVDADPEKAARTLAHELGHVLGLDHNEDERSVMFQTILGGPWRLLPDERSALLRVLIPEGRRP